ncbi:MAG: Gfo/Idh/MocA family oxidoreductase [Candidatus Omnitrophica bacterium]|nr:Gfo/Idh/MocA family oxidoreductase [Candidatus Omnitrophota bacterium]
MNDRTRKVGIGILGAGFMGKTYAETVSKMVNRAELMGVACGSRSGALAEEYGVAHFDGVEDLLASPGIDAVFIATPHSAHAEQAIACAEAGKHILIEKPMASSVEDCDRILEACDKHSVHSTIAFSQRTRVCNRAAKELLDSGKLGKIHHIRTCQTVPGGMPNLPKWQMEKENLGTLFGHAIHNFDAVRWLTGGEIATVYAKCRSTDPAVTTEGTADVLMTVDTGATAYLLCSFQLPKPGFPRSGYAFQAICENGLLDIDAYGEARASIGGGEWETIAEQEPIDWQGKGALDPVRLKSYSLHLNDFISSILEGRPPAITGWDGRQAVAAALAAYISNESGEEVRLS